MTALTMTMTACSPSSFTPGASVPTGANPPAQGNPTASTEFDTVQGQATLKGVPLKNAEVRVYNAITGAPALLSAGGANLIAAGGANLTAPVVAKTDAEGNFSVNLAGLTTGNVARVVISSEGKSVSALMDASGGFIDRKGYAVTADRTVNVSANEISKLADILVAELLKSTNNVKDANKRGEIASRLLSASSSTATQALGGGLPPFFVEDLVEVQVTGTVTLSAATKETLEKNLGSSAASLAQAVTDFATQLATQAASGQTIRVTGSSFVQIPGVKISLVNGKLTIGDTVINVDTQEGQVDPETNEPQPSEVVFSAEPGSSPDARKGEWQYQGSFTSATATVTFVDENTMTVTQNDKAEQIQSMKLIVPASSLNGYFSTGGRGFIESLSGTVTGNLQSRKAANGTVIPGAARSGTITFENIATMGGHAHSATIRLGSYGQIGSIGVIDAPQALDVTMWYSSSVDKAVEIVGSHTTTISSSALDLISKSGLYVKLTTNGGSAEIQY